MNVIFTFIFLISLVVFAVFSPDKALEAMTGGGQKAVGLSMNLIVIYAVWSGVLQIAEDSGIIKKLSVKLRRPINLLFGELTDDESDDVAVNISANLLGMGGIASAEDAIEMILAGASAVSVGTANFVQPDVTEEIVAGIRDYMERYHFETVADMVGIVK